MPRAAKKESPGSKNSGGTTGKRGRPRKDPYEDVVEVLDDSDNDNDNIKGESEVEDDEFPKAPPSTTTTDKKVMIVPKGNETHCAKLNCRLIKCRSLIGEKVKLISHLHLFASDIQN